MPDDGLYEIEGGQGAVPEPAGPASGSHRNGVEQLLARALVRRVARAAEELSGGQQISGKRARLDEYRRQLEVSFALENGSRLRTGDAREPLCLSSVLRLVVRRREHPHRLGQLAEQVR